ncbi:MAG TPA: tetratricopeptide repeat protein, partial [Steroidobacteraceae bacterium]
MAMVDSVADQMRKAMAEHQRGELVSAEAAYHKILGETPEHPDALHYLGMLRFQQQREPESITLLRRSIDAAPGNPHVWNNLGNILYARGERDEALEAYERAVALQPNLSAGWHNLGNLHRRAKRLDRAIVCFQNVLSVDGAGAKPGADFRNALESLVNLLQRTRRTEELAQTLMLWRSHFPDDPVARHMVAAVTGKDVPPRASAEYVKDLFDRFAESFDHTLKMLDYKAPQMLAEALSGEPEYQRGQARVLDAGCGTGLCAALVRSSARFLVGVDLSPAMQEKARALGLYDELCTMEICEFMRGRPSLFDVIIACDTLEYFGDLGDFYAAAHTTLSPGGLLLFTVEAMPPNGSNDDYLIQPHGRYCHRADYVRQAAYKAGFVDLLITEGPLRREWGEEVPG